MNIQKMQASHLDRVLAVILMLTAVVMGAFSDLSGERNAAILGISLSFLLLLSCIRYNPTGWWAQYKFFGDRVEYYVNEGIFFVPWFLGFTHLKADCRDQIFRLSSVTVFTSDNIRVILREILIVWRIFHLGLYHNLKREELTSLLDDVVDKNVKSPVRESGLRDVIKMDLGTTQILTRKDLENWGIEISKIIVSQPPEPTDENVRTALQLETTEKFDQVGQRVKAQNLVSLVILFSTSQDKGGAGLNPEQAYEAAQIVIGDSTKATTAFTFPPNVLAAITALLGRK